MKFDDEALEFAARAVEESATVWEGFAMQDAKVCVAAYLTKLKERQIDTEKEYGVFLP
ncbi:hypothetical protein [Ralstonia phage RSP15]|uniref:hypothetical protein n=1 Tax=Ralstonia phage RSP15 TaxID=1785960 RepID=UPI00074D3B5F|nr:hypothetical protein BH754_gp013 [Ralstonia phage RSP15]BAU39971.1 hypothetical protein [Ralstonia phage RSP15]